MITIGVVKPEGLTPDELGYIVKYAQNCWEPFNPEETIHRVRSGQAIIYRMEGDVTGLFIISNAYGGCFIETVAGKNIMKNFNAVYEKIKQVALAGGVQSIYTYASPGLARLLKRRTQAKPVAVLFKENF